MVKNIEYKNIDLNYCNGKRKIMASILGCDQIILD